jgi:hypothetical protein
MAFMDAEQMRVVAVVAVGSSRTVLGSLQGKRRC